MLTFPVLIDTATGTKQWWNLKIMENLYSKLYDGLLKKHVYCKFIGLGGPREYDKNDGSGKGISYDMLVTGVEMQNGEFIQADKEPGSEG